MSEAIQDSQQAASTHQARSWEHYVWPRWLPIRARLPLIAQITAVTALLAALMMPGWSDAHTGDVTSAATARNIAHDLVVPHAQPVAPEPPPVPTRPAHLNLDVRHNFGSLTVSVIVDDERVLDATIEGSRKRFGAFGKRSEKGFTKTLDLDPGVRVVRVRVRSAEDKFDQTRVERFELGPSSVASMRIAADKSGLSIFADRPAPPPVIAQVMPVLPAPGTASVNGSQPAAAAEPSAAAELYKALRNMLIAVSGFIASAATGFVVQEFLRQKKRVLGL